MTVKRHLTICLYLIQVIIAMAANMKVVGISTQLNIREDASEQSAIIGKLSNGEVVKFICEMDPESAIDSKYYWYKIRYGETEGWVLSNHLEMTNKKLTWAEEDTEQHVVHSLHEGITYIFGKIFHTPTFEHHANWLLYISLAWAIIITFITNHLTRIIRDINVNNDCMFWFRIVLFVAQNIVLMVYCFGHVAPLWFITPSTVGWVATFLNAIGVIFFIIAYFEEFFSLLAVCNYRGDRSCKFHYAAWTFYISFFIWWFNNFDMHNSGFYAFWIMVGSQIVQLLYMIYSNIRYEGSWSNLFFTVCLYILGIFCGLLTMMGTIEVILAVVILFLINIAPDSKTKRTSTCSSHSRDIPNHININYTADGTPYYNGSDGRMHTLNESGCLWTDSDGNSFDSSGYKH